MSEKMFCEACGEEVRRKREMVPEIESYEHVGEDDGCLFPWSGTPKEEAMTDKKRIAEIRGRLAKATDGPWKPRLCYAQGSDVPYYADGMFSDPAPGVRQEIFQGALQVPNANLIANAPTDLKWALDTIESQAAELADTRENAAKWQQIEDVFGPDDGIHDPGDLTPAAVINAVDRGLVTPKSTDSEKGTKP